jgi:hypothetical protein
MDDIDNIIDINADKETIAHIAYETENFAFIIEYIEPPEEEDGERSDILSFSVATDVTYSTINIVDADVQDLRDIAEIILKLADAVDEMKGNTDKEADILPFEKPKKKK